MGAQLNIKDAETIRLARELADATGQPVTKAIRAALEQELARREAEIQVKIERANAIVAEFQRHMPEEWRGKTSKEIMDSIYDEHGLPK
jgi:antitoxin VapB